MKKRTKIRCILAASAVMLNIVMNLCGNALKTEHYTLTSDKLTQPVRIVFISDLHNCTYGGKEQTQLWEEIGDAQPDVVLFGGDVIDIQDKTENALYFMQKVQESYPCAYASGNHEVMRGDGAEFYAEAEALGIPVLHGTYVDIPVKTQEIRLCGIVHVYDEPGQLTACCQFPDADKYTILLLHQPEQLDTVTGECAKYGTNFDLVLSGHAHGGQWRIPYFLEQGLYAPDQGIFPEFTGGQREMDGTVQIVSRGLAKPLRMLLIPRIFNRPELSVIDILPE